MSETVQYKGSLVPINMADSVEETAKLVLGKTYRDDEYDTAVEQIRCESDDYVLVGDKIYQVLREYIDPDTDHFIATRCDNGCIDFDVEYYTGGRPFEEAIEEALKGLE